MANNFNYAVSPTSDTEKAGSALASFLQNFALVYNKAKDSEMEQAFKERLANIQNNADQVKEGNTLNTHLATSGFTRVDKTQATVPATQIDAINQANQGVTIPTPQLDAQGNTTAIMSPVPKITATEQTYQEPSDNFIPASKSQQLADPSLLGHVPPPKDYSKDYVTIWQKERDNVDAKISSLMADNKIPDEVKNSLGQLNNASAKDIDRVLTFGSPFWSTLKDPETNKIDPTLYAKVAAIAQLYKARSDWDARIQGRLGTGTTGEVPAKTNTPNKVVAPAGDEKVAAPSIDPKVAASTWSTDLASARDYIYNKGKDRNAVISKLKSVYGENYKNWDMLLPVKKTK